MNLRLTSRMRTIFCIVHGKYKWFRRSLLVEPEPESRVSMSKRSLVLLVHTTYGLGCE
jgi:hypothetical protein